MRKVAWPFFFLPLHLGLAAFIIFKSSLVSYSVIFFLRYLIEALACGLLGLILLSFPSRLFKCLFCFYFLLYLSALVVQLISYNSTLAFLPRMALENTDNARLFWNSSNLTIGFMGALIFACGLWRALRKPFEVSSRRSVFITSLVVGAALLLVVDTPARNYLRTLRDKNSHRGRSFALSDAPPLRALAYSLFGLSERRAGKDSYPKSLAVELEPFSVESPFPFLKPHIYSSPIPFPRLKAAKRKQNLLIIFSEGLSARTVGFYNQRFRDLTPNITRFAKESRSLAFLNYYNHTAATFHGLRGQLCSVFPRNVPNSAWREGGQPKLFCLADYFRDEGYFTAFLDPHERKGDYLNDMLSSLGFNEVLTAKEIAERLAPQRRPEKISMALSDADLFEGLYNFLRAPERKAAPFFVATYAFGTHAWLDSPEGGVKFGDGSNNALNTIRELDHQFGEFWKKFQALDIYKDTLVVFTTDHAHFHEDSYVNAILKSGANDYAGFFVDQIPLIIHDPSRGAPATFDAKFASSLHLAPTLIHFMGQQNRPAPFLGKSIFERDSERDIASYGENFFIFDKSGIYDLNASEDPQQEAIKAWVRRSLKVIEEDRVWSSKFFTSQQ